MIRQNPSPELFVPPPVSPRKMQGRNRKLIDTILAAHQPRDHHMTQGEWLANCYELIEAGMLRIAIAAPIGPDSALDLEIPYIGPDALATMAEGLT
jgi:hypothetical protein